MDVRYEHDAWCAGLVHTNAERRRFSVSDSPSSSLAMWKQSVMASVVREKSSELNVSPSERFYIAHLVFQSTSRADDGKCQEGTLLGLLVLLLRSPQRRSSDVVAVR